MRKRSICLLSIVAVLVFSILGTGSAIAIQGVIPSCQYLPLANNPITTGVPNNTVCVDIPVNLSENHVVFNIDAVVTRDGTASGIPAALRHIWMMGMAMQARVRTGKMDAANIQIIGIMYGPALAWGLSDVWWQKQTDKHGNQLYPNGTMAILIKNG